ncbi:MAG: phosphate ABC transporter substrate-binding protein [Thermoplasmatales archaeon]|nr:phosphate ABC transporter substrate-binding protein [Thermoplasmatales archaeon]
MMKMNKIKKLLPACVICIALVGCIGTRETINIAGSTTVLPIVQKCADRYMQLHPEVDVRVSGGGSSMGIKNVGDGIVDIGMASRDIKDSEKSNYPDLVKHVIAKDGIAIIVHPSNPLSNLTSEQLKGIYNGTYTRWEEFGWTGEIVVVGRDTASGTGEFFWEHVMKKENFTSGMLALPSNGAVHDKVASTQNAIGFVGIGYISNKVKALKLDGIEPTLENVKNKVYPLARELYLFTKGEPTGLTKDFINFVKSDEGQKIVEEEGFIPL